MKTITKEECQVFVPIVISTTLNLIARWVESEYAQGFLQGMALATLVYVLAYLIIGIKRRTVSPKKKHYGNS